MSEGARSRVPNRAPLSGLVDLWGSSSLIDRILDHDPDVGAPEVVRPFLIAGLAERAQPLLIVAARSRDAETLALDLKPWFGEEDVSLFPAWEVLPGESMSPTLEAMGKRIKIVHDVQRGLAPKVIVASVRALLQKVAVFEGKPIELAPGMSLSLDELSESLISFGFERNYLVERPGEFSVRGGILDVFPADASGPIRADFFGDELAELKTFSISSQRSHDDIERAVILPCRELRLDEKVRAKAQQLLDVPDPIDIDENRTSDLEKIANGVSFAGMEMYLSLLAGPLRQIAEFFPVSGRMVLVEPKRCADRAVDFLAQASEWGSPDTEGMFASFDDVIASVSDDHLPVQLWAFGRAEEGVDLDVKGWDEHVGHPDQLANKLIDLRKKSATVIVGAGASASRIQDVLSDAGLGLTIGDAEPGAAVIIETQIDKGFLITIDGASLAVVGTSDLFGRRRSVVTTSVETPARATALLLQLAPGDHVVHETYGLGRYHGMITREIGGISRDYLIIEYHGDDKLYLPTEQLEAITKYTGGEAPRLNRLGTAEWEKAKTRARRAVADIAGELMVLYSKRLQSPGHSFGPDTPWQRELEDAFAHIETPDQERAIEEVKNDMQRPIPMDRLICGDVGYGKTEVAVRAAFKAIQDSKQVAVLVPTTILAQQHTQTFSERFAGFPVRVAQLSRFLSPAEQAHVLEELGAGKVDVVIGTHRLLQPDVKFSDLGLLVVDEEQRFGVKHKERIKHLREHIDVLTMTATPIPRTLEMGITGIRDLSLMDTPPVDRRPVLTYVGEADERMITAAIRRELARDGQVFFVHNRVRSIKGAARKIAGLVPGARVEVAHGQMTESELERVMIDVWDGKIDVLVCTTIIESGLDIPTMNTLIVERADLLGLSQLYQLRGRVGRARERAYAYLLYPHEAVLTDEAHERLKTLSEFTELGSGFKIALRDLEIRGAGNLLGAEQSGHIAAVGFDLYMKMMSEAVASLSGTEPDKKLEVKLDIPADAFVPSTYIARESLRMEAYRQIEKVRSPEDVSALADEFADRYGPVPEPVTNLLTVAELRAFLADNAIAEAGVRDGVLKLRPFPLLSDSQEVRLRRKFRGATYKQSSDTLLLPVPAKDLVKWVLDSLRAILA
ncbi:MAG: transcription-repair coupling factor [Actinomycetota bacterium]|nr:transcription-repair coupling factor [Actinomycetota bacterium]